MENRGAIDSIGSYSVFHSSPRFSKLSRKNGLERKKENCVAIDFKGVTALFS
jgi:hypothetical protein